MRERWYTIAAKIKKVILFIVEGMTDETALSPILKGIFQNDDVRFHVVHGDMTSDFAVSSTNAINTVHQHIEIEKKRYGFKKNDIIKVIHLVDTDGAFIPSKNVIVSSKESIQYFDDRIESMKPDDIIYRNARKAQILQRLYSTHTVGKIPYSIYYFSRNLEHVLHNNNINLKSDEKLDYADSFANMYKSDQEKFIIFISSSEFAVPGDFKDTWNFIMQGINSLHRYCNFHLLFRKNE